MERHFRRSIDSLENVFGFIEQFFGEAQIAPTLLHPVSFATEELFTNMVKYNASGPNDILLRMEPVDGGVTVSLVDYDSDHFDVTQAPRPATDVPLKNREVGGLGLLLVKHMVDSLRYEYADRRSTVSFTRTLGTSDVRDQSR